MNEYIYIYEFSFVFIRSFTLLIYAIMQFGSFYFQLYRSPFTIKLLCYYSIYLSIRNAYAFQKKEKEMLM